MKKGEKYTKKDKNDKIFYKGEVFMQFYKNPNKPIEERVEDLLKQMTLDEKIAQLGSFWSYGLF